MRADDNSKMKNKNLMKRYLTENNREMLNKYEKGYISVKDIIKDTDLDRHYFYNVANELDGSLGEKRKENRFDELEKLVDQILLCIPFEYIEIDYNVVFGERSNIKSETKTKQKVRLTNILTKNKIMPKNFKCISIERTLSTWYRTYLFSKEILAGDKSGYSIAKDYNLNPSKVYDVRDYMRNNDNNKILASESDEQEQQFLKNMEIYEKYKNGESKESLSQKYKIDIEYIGRIIESLKEIDYKFKSVRVRVESKKINDDETHKSVEDLAEEFELTIDEVNDILKDNK